MARLSVSTRLPTEPEPEPEPDFAGDTYDESIPPLPSHPPSRSEPVPIPALRRLPALQPLPALKQPPRKRNPPPPTMERPLTPPLENVPTSRREVPSPSPQLRPGAMQAQGTIQTRKPTLKPTPEPEPHESLFAAFIPSRDPIPSAVPTHSATLPVGLPSRRLSLALLLLASGALAAAAVWLGLIY